MNLPAFRISQLRQSNPVAFALVKHMQFARAAIICRDMRGMQTTARYFGRLAREYLDVAAAQFANSTPPPGRKAT